MDPHNTNTELEEKLAERLKQLPKVVQDAITSADVEKRLRSLADTHKLHIDQWQILENEVMLTLLGFQQIENLEKNIKEQVGVTAEEAHSLTESANTIVFEPIREELERQLEHPDAHAKEETGIEAARSSALQGAGEEQRAAAAPPSALAVQPATPPASATEVKVSRPAESTTYKPGETSAQRATVHEDPYRLPQV